MEITFDVPKYVTGRWMCISLLKLILKIMTLRLNWMNKQTQGPWTLIWLFNFVKLFNIFSQLRTYKDLLFVFL